MKKLFMLLALLCLMVTGCSSVSSEASKDGSKIIDISVQEVKQIVDNYSDYPNVYIIDVREAEEFALGHIEGAINIPLSSLEKISIDTERELIVYCQSGRRSAEAALILMDMGYLKVSDMGGINAWSYELIEETVVSYDYDFGGVSISWK